MRTILPSYFRFETKGGEPWKWFVRWWLGCPFWLEQHNNRGFPSAYYLTRVTMRLDCVGGSISRFPSNYRGNKIDTEAQIAFANYFKTTRTKTSAYRAFQKAPGTHACTRSHMCHIDNFLRKVEERRTTRRVALIMILGHIGINFPNVISEFERIGLELIISISGEKLTIISYLHLQPRVIDVRGGGGGDGPAAPAPAPAPAPVSSSCRGLILAAPSNPRPLPFAP
ncbi:hypothetical protein PUN28_000729 [Cardiocondyla obscurior]|uniref:Uncharacterized protein n=1 Tax=Cardiocondyla obscurior TaxID=286306 RepID=A0AAW2H0Y6_9HYME